MSESPVPVFDAVAIIDEPRCIGCTLCIQVCPVDAIVGAAKVMHTVISAHCTGCRLCVPPCPVDCIEIQEIAPREAVGRAADEAAALGRYERRNARIRRERAQRTARLEQERKKRDTIARAIARARERLVKS